MEMKTWNDLTIDERMELRKRLDEKGIPKIPKSGKNHQRLLVLIGDKCIFCGRDYSIQFHEIYCNTHSTTMKYYREHKNDFVSLCFRCHHLTHQMHNEISLSFEEIKKIFDIIRDFQEFH